MKNAILLIGISLLIISCSSSHKINDNDAQISSEEIIKLLKSAKSINIKDKTITGDLDFTSLENHHQVAAWAHTCVVESSVYFDNCVFEGSLIGFRKGSSSNYMCSFKSDVVFRNCRIKGNVSLEHARFKGYFTFSQNQVEGSFSAANAIMSDHTLFEETHFEQDFSLSYTQFLQRSNFMDIIVEGKTYLLGSIFQGQSLWSNASFTDYVDITKVNVRSSFFMDHCEFKDQLYVSGSFFWGYVNLASARFHDTLTIRTSTFLQLPILDSETYDSLKSEKNRIVTDENLDFYSMNK